MGTQNEIKIPDTNYENTKSQKQKMSIFALSPIFPFEEEMLIYPTLYKNECEKQTMSLFSHNAKNDENGFRLSIDIPGVKQEDINIKSTKESYMYLDLEKCMGTSQTLKKYLPSLAQSMSKNYKRTCPMEYCSLQPQSN